MSSLLRPRAALAIAFLTSAAVLMTAHAFERIGGLAPCLLCLDQREAHWTALGLILLGSLTFASAMFPRLLRAGALALVCASYLWSAGLAGYHAGVEWGWFEGPQACAAGGVGTVPSPGDIAASLSAPGPAGPSCSEAAWRLVGISMAGYNALISAALAVLVGAATRRLVRSGARPQIGS